MKNIRRIRQAEDIKTLLCIDDDQAICTLLQLIFQSHFEVTVIANPYEALAKVKNHKFDMVITDLNMPNVSGLEIIRALQLAHPETPIAVASGSDESDRYVKMALELGACAVIPKPFLKRAELCRIVGDIIREKQVS